MWMEGREKGISIENVSNKLKVEDLKVRLYD